MASVIFGTTWFRRIFGTRIVLFDYNPVMRGIFLVSEQPRRNGGRNKMAGGRNDNFTAFKKKHDMGK